MTIILSASMIVWRRCATVITCHQTKVLSLCRRATTKARLSRAPSSRTNRAVGKLVSNGALNELVRLIINIGRGLIHDQNFRFSQQCASKAQELSLAYAEVGTTLRYVGLKATIELFDDLTATDRFNVSSCHFALR
eukprot:m.223741 g.223741  ORF g.223741 m.223741 type:complete len:136 (-) comp10827_c0_seq9:12-419(-)